MASFSHRNHRRNTAAAAQPLAGWIAGQRPWQAIPTGWTVPGELEGWRFRVKPAPGGVRVIALSGAGEPAVWFVPGRG